MNGGRGECVMRVRADTGCALSRLSLLIALPALPTPRTSVVPGSPSRSSERSELYLLTQRERKQFSFERVFKRDSDQTITAFFT